MDRINILLADKEGTINGFEYYVMALKDLGAWDVRLSLDPEKAEDVDGIIVPGSYNDINPALWGEEVCGAVKIDDELDEGQQRILDIACKKEIPVLGMCRGIQFINVYFGGTINQHLKAAEAHTTRIPDRFHKLYTTPGTFMEKLYGESLMVNSRHHQAVGRVGEGLQVAARWVCEDTTGRAEKEGWEKEVVDVLVHESHPIIGLQWHPERMMYTGITKERKETGKKMLEYYMDMVRKYHASSGK
ncbi:MAG: gamma-glutamyl-gamma-aminobutyrate hydrolase family protein [Anaerovoracaceae bacterium]|nr:gamma-glutamyl-gamma-aminobutyrate hydrolase family protein [Anaerovoracaceae bacterium]